MSRSVLVTAITGLLTIASMSTADSTSVILDEEHQGKGNKGSEYRPLDTSGELSGLVLSAWSSIDRRGPFDPDASHGEGSVYIDRGGAGVKPDSGCGSKGISGYGSFKDEQLNFTFDDPALAHSIQLGFIKFRPNYRLHSGDDPVIFIHLVGEENMVVLDETDYMNAFTSTGRQKGYIDFASLGFGDAMVDWFGVRETRGSIEVSGASFSVVPLPPGLLLGAAGLAGVGYLRLRKGGRGA